MLTGPFVCRNSLCLCLKMSKVQILRALLKQRLPAGDEEIFELFERTTAEYEEELCGLKEENERQRKLLEAAFNSDDETDVQPLLVKQTEVSPEQEAWMPNLEQEDPELNHIKKEEEEVWTCDEREHLQVLEVNSSKYTNDDVKPEFSHCHQPQSEENKEAEPFASSSAEQMKTAEPESDVTDVDCKETKEPKSGLNSLKDDILPCL
ncbi:uncharacterized protein LOC117525969 isoform X2 [Thalassophryne amazonica]|uniref:uncharacterized protein LOC117525969 isoform X2 n=1 Tax=Thalassophryne amazonica TaxID=390379 RepID=UPI001471F7D8|nr:uncharacterized protein LOC117525969 isoform X2 [Thalassophryne amazonica]